MAKSDLMALTPKKDKRLRRMQRFWLDENNIHDAWLLYYCDQWKRKKRFQTVVKKALQIYAALEEGRVDWLLKEFPKVDRMIVKHHYRQQREHSER